MKTPVTSTVAAIALVCTLVACGGSAATPASIASTSPSAPTASAAPSASTATAITVKDFTLDPKDVRVQANVPLAVTNAGPTVHNIAIREPAGAVVATTKDLRTGESETIAPPLAAGAYVLFCSLPGHESLGIKGTLTVE